MTVNKFVRKLLNLKGLSVTHFQFNILADYAKVSGNFAIVSPQKREFLSGIGMILNFKHQQQRREQS